MSTEATGLIREGDRMVGVTAQGPDGALEIRAEPDHRRRRPALHAARRRRASR